MHRDLAATAVPLCRMITDGDDRAMVLMLTAAASPGDRVSGLTLPVASRVTPDPRP